MQPFELLGDHEATLLGLGFPVAQEARVYSPGTVLGFPVRERRMAPYGSFMRGLGDAWDRGNNPHLLGRARGIVMDGLGDACPTSWTDPFMACDCPSGTFTVAYDNGTFGCVADLPKKPDGSTVWDGIKSVGGAVISFVCQSGASWACPKVSSSGGVPVVTPPPWYATTGGMLGILGGAVALGVGAYFMARK